MVSIVTAAVLLACVTYVAGRGSGAPTSACVSLTPGHNGAQSTPPPYNITLTATEYTEGVPVTVSVTSGYQGILIQARKADNSSTIPLGSFSSSPANTKKMNCTNADDSVTHSSTTVKNTTVFIWNPPSGDMGNIHFVATIASGKNMYWVALESESQLQYKSVNNTNNGNNGTNANNGTNGNNVGNLQSCYTLIFLAFAVFAGSLM